MLKILQIKKGLYIKNIVTIRLLLFNLLYYFNTHFREEICILLAHKVSGLGLKSFAEIVYANGIKDEKTRKKRKAGDERVKEIGSSPIEPEEEEEEDPSSESIMGQKEYTPTVIASQFTEESVSELSLYQKTMKCGDQR